MAMNRLMQMPLKERNSMGQRAQQRVTERYDLERVLDLWESLYSTLLAQNPLPFRWGRAHRAGFPQPSTCRGLPPI